MINQNIDMKYNTLYKLYKNGIMVHKSKSNVFVPNLDCRKSLYYQDIIREHSSLSRVRRVSHDLFLDDTKLEFDNVSNKYLVLLSSQIVMKEKIDMSIKSFRKSVIVRSDEKVDKDNNKENMRKAIRRFTDICMLNDWTCFCTLTFDPSICDRYSPFECLSLFQKFVHNYFRANPGFYIAVPEIHLDGAFHFHVLMDISLKDKKIVRAISPYTGAPLFNDFGLALYNLLGWKYGNSSLVYFSDVYKVSTAVKYLTRYLTPSSKVLPHWYYSGGALKRKPVLVYANTDDKYFDDLIDIGAQRYVPVGRDGNALNYELLSYWYDNTSMIDEFYSKADIVDDPYSRISDKGFVEYAKSVPKVKE